MIQTLKRKISNILCAYVLADAKAAKHVCSALDVHDRDVPIPQAFGCCCRLQDELNWLI